MIPSDRPRTLRRLQIQRRIGQCPLSQRPIRAAAIPHEWFPARISPGAVIGRSRRPAPGLGHHRPRTPQPNSKFDLMIAEPNLLGLTSRHASGGLSLHIEIIINSIAYLRPNHSVAIPRKEKNPTTSVTVVTNGPDDTAGSTPSLANTKRNQRFRQARPTTSTVTIASAMTSPRSETWNQLNAITPMISAKQSPLSTPTSNSRRMTRPTFAAR